ncbi:MAG: hypothetical protein WD825_01285 [Gemmatimonadaceae bacterium]
MTTTEALAFVRRAGVVLESARGPVPSLAETIAGERIRGSYWAHPKGNTIFLRTRSIRKSPDVLVCRLLGGKVTYVHRRLWPALVRMANRIGPDRLAAIREVHTVSGKHRVVSTRYPDWVPPSVRRAAKALDESDAVAELPFAIPSAIPVRRS